MLCSEESAVTEVVDHNREDLSVSSTETYVSFDYFATGTEKECLIVDSFLSKSSSEYYSSVLGEEKNRLIRQAKRLQNEIKHLQDTYRNIFVTYRRQILVLVERISDLNLKISTCFEPHELELILDQIKQRYNNFIIKEKHMKQDFIAVDKRFRNSIYNKHQSLTAICKRLLDICKDKSVMSLQEYEKWKSLYQISSNYISACKICKM